MAGHYCAKCGSPLEYCMCEVKPKLLLAMLLCSCGGYEIKPGTYQATVQDQVYSCSGLVSHQGTASDFTDTWTITKQGGSWNMTSVEVPASWVGIETDDGLYFEAAGYRTERVARERLCTYTFVWGLTLVGDDTGFHGTQNYHTQLNECGIVYDQCENTAIVRGINE